ncbi:hypothetical protein RH858_06365 [Halalkaliarchaeum sp. AArc-GB]|uniref:DUF7554 family protein n=1 Tax=Halalkaliarchaeum sp. AArc-GB TaxID=3074078 RepID=UPI00285FFAD0|nr:hypothetical protein [Halalkaliarchaeum sp. AArc-GB]MDR5672773.1 hypothetical protein [Halalkaliarchaeum sp. AArc-GB]
MDLRSAIEVETLLKIVLGLVVMWLVLEVLGAVLRITTAFFRLLTPVIGLVIVILIVLWLLDRI